MAFRHLLMLSVLETLRMSWRSQMSAWVERMGPMYHEGAYFDDAVTVSFSTLCIFGINLTLTLQISLENQSLVLKILILFV